MILNAMKILALETSTHACSAAFLEGTSENFNSIERFELAPRNHTQLILPMIDAVLDEAGYTIHDMDVLAFGRGPGAFTGVRVATGVVQAISYGADLPVAQISSLAAIAQGVYRQYQQSFNKTVRRVLVANDARMGEMYFAAYEYQDGFMTLQNQERLIKPESLLELLDTGDFDKSWTAVGSGWQEFYEQLADKVLGFEQLQEDYEYPHAQDIAYLALNEAGSGNLVKAEQVRPVYLRDNVAKKPQPA